MRNKTIKEMTMYAMFIAILAILSFTPLGYLSIGAVSFTIIHIIVLIAAFTFGVKGGVITGLIFGVFSMLRAIVAPNTLADLIFRNPLVSVLPRVLFGLIAGLFYEVIRKFDGLFAKTSQVRIAELKNKNNNIDVSEEEKKETLKNKVKSHTILGVLSGVATFLHTAMVLPLMYLIGKNMQDTAALFESTAFSALFGGVMLSNGILEIVLAVVIVPLVCLAIVPVVKKQLA
ncbi:MAG: ECF transporter S component [Erysipelotrichales bacterium]|nr:ECF transporter S component [Erysipelotrichales bacterium]